MDPISHALIGMAVSAAGQGQFSLLSPVTIAATAGSILPDGDIILQFFGDKIYLKHHRGVTHSLIGIVLESVFTASLLKSLYSNTPYLTLLIWVFIGCSTHILSDILNSYGAKIFWPLSNKMWSLSLLVITDPILIALSAISIVSSYGRLKIHSYIIGFFTLYIVIKALMHLYGNIILKRKFEQSFDVEDIHLLPAMIAGHKFHYIIDTRLYKIVGEINFLSGKVKIINIFKRLDSSKRSSILKTKAASYFKEFTPIFHVDLEKVQEGYRALLTDLRYILKGKYLHHASIIYDENMNIIEQKFHPYSINNKLDI